MRSRFITAIACATLGLALAAPLAAQVSVEAEIARRIVDRMPQDPGTSFPVDVGEVFCWSSVTGAAGTTIQHVWIHGDMEFAVSQEIGGSPWRTWSSKTIPPEWAGEWRVEIRDRDGNLLDTMPFTVGSLP
jgi:hypothetical protein